MDGLVDDGAAAVFGDLALPARVVLGGAIPLHVAAGEHHAAESPGIDRRLERARRIAKARLEDGADAHARLRGFVQDVIRAFDRGVERLLDHEVLARADGRERRNEMQRRRCRDANRIEAGLREQWAMSSEAKLMPCSAANFSAVPRVRLTTPTRRPPLAAATARAWKCAMAPAPMKPKPGVMIHSDSLLLSLGALARSSLRTSIPDGLIWLIAQPPSGLAPGNSAAEDSRMSATDQFRGPMDSSRKAHHSRVAASFPTPSPVASGFRLVANNAAPRSSAFCASLRNDWPCVLA